MCKRMENSQGDLADILRNSGLTAPTQIPDDDGWHLLPEPPSSFASPADNFGDPFSDIGDPFLDELPAANFFNSAETGLLIKTGSGGGDGAQKMLLGEQGKSSLFSRMLQISPVNSKAPPPVIIGPPPLVATSADHNRVLQNTSPRMQGMKRRKNQVKKVVCIPAPPAANGRPSGEVVPSDLWAWRKYGQKPIKGSPYPRGYYRCSSSKGCSARKQVERSRTDPNMLVITYTAEHNHPWPTQRNVLAGSTRSQPSKASSNASTSKSSPHNKNRSTNAREEHGEWPSSSMQAVKEEEGAQEMEKALADHRAHDFDRVFEESFMMPDSSQPDSFFTDLTELETDPMHLIFPKGFMGDDHKLDGERDSSKGMDPFNMFDWGGGGSSLEDPKRD